MTLLHYLVDIADNENPDLLNFTSQLSNVVDARKLSLESMKMELVVWKNQVHDLQTNLKKHPGDLLDLMNGSKLFLHSIHFKRSSYLFDLF